MELNILSTEVPKSLYIYIYQFKYRPYVKQ